MALTADQRKAALAVADKLRDVLRDMNAMDVMGNAEIRQISSLGYGRVRFGLSDVLAVLTEGRVDDYLSQWLLDNPDESTEWCIDKWETYNAPLEYIQYTDQARLRDGTLGSRDPFMVWRSYQLSREDWSE